MSGLELAIAAAALLAGLTGTWSPCGFSMIETIGPVGHTGGRATTLAACATFALGALVGGVLTFGSLAWLGALLHGAGRTRRLLAAAAIAVAAAIAELRGVADRAADPPPAARALAPGDADAARGRRSTASCSGSASRPSCSRFGVFALAGIAFALGDPAIGLGIGLAFGVGRALPIVAVAPIADRDAGIRVTEAMAGRPAIYRGFRFGDGLALLAAAAALVVAVARRRRAHRGEARRRPVGGDRATSPSSAPTAPAFIRRGGGDVALPGTDPALGDGRVAVIAGGQIRLLSGKDLAVVGRIPAAGADAVAISRHWVVWRARRHGRDLMRARNVADPASPGPSSRSAGPAARASSAARASTTTGSSTRARPRART